MRPVPVEEPKTQLAELFSAALEEKGKSMKDVAEAIDSTYEHVRRIFRGEGLPSKYVMKAICEYLGVPYKDAERLAVADKIKKKYGAIPIELSGKNPELEPIERVWGKLTTEQQGTVIDMVNSFVRRNRVAKSA